MKDTTLILVTALVCSIINAYEIHWIFTVLAAMPAISYYIVKDWQS